MKKRFFEAFLFLVLFSSLGSTAPPYVECQDLYPDEWLDLFGISQNSVNITTVLIPQPATFSFSDVIPDDRIFQTHDLKGLHLDVFTLERVSSVTLRC